MQPFVLHGLLALMFLWMTAADVPTHWLSKRLAQWLDAFSFDVTTWFEGICQILAASIMLGMPVNIYGSLGSIWWRLLTGYMLEAAGLFNIVRHFLLQ